MTQRNELTSQPIHPVSIVKRALQGAGIALIIISIFLLGVGEPNPDWGKLWMIRPLVIVSAAGALGGVFFYFMGHLRQQGGWIKILAIILSLLGYLFVLWVGTVLGLDGTLWD